MRCFSFTILRFIFLCVYRFCYGSISWLPFYHLLLFTGSLRCGQVKKIWSLIKLLLQSRKYQANYEKLNR